MGRSLIAIKLSVLLFVLSPLEFPRSAGPSKLVHHRDVYGDVKSLDCNSTLCHNWS